MANIKSAIKRAKQNDQRRAHNAGQRSKYRTAIKKVLKAILTNDHTTAMDSFRACQKTLDQSVSHGLIHKNKAARIKSRLNTKIKVLAA